MSKQQVVRISGYAIAATVLVFLGVFLAPRQEDPMLIHRGGRVLIVRLPADEQAQQQITVIEPLPAANEAASISTNDMKTGQLLWSRKVSQSEWEQISALINKLCGSFPSIPTATEEESFYRVDFACGRGVRLAVPQDAAPLELQELLKLITNP